MPDDRDDPTKSSDAARNQAEADSRNCTNPTDTRNWAPWSRDAYQVEWDRNHKS